MGKNYTPIDCGLYDELELLAMRGTLVKIELNSGETFKDTISTFKTRKNAGEFLILKSRREIRLDELKTVNGIEFSKLC